MALKASLRISIFFWGVNKRSIDSNSASWSVYLTVVKDAVFVSMSDYFTLSQICWAISILTFLFERFSANSFRIGSMSNAVNTLLPVMFWIAPVRRPNKEGFSSFWFLLFSYFFLKFEKSISSSESIKPKCFRLSFPSPMNSFLMLSRYSDFYYFSSSGSITEKSISFISFSVIYFFGPVIKNLYLWYSSSSSSRLSFFYPLLLIVIYFLNFSLATFTSCN